MLNDYSAATFDEILEIVRTLRHEWNPDRGEEEFWFRGAGKGHPLLPSLYRPKELTCKFDEITIFEAFKALGSPLAPPNIISQWDWYFLARHHGLPTRLLDWSSSLFSAVFFALEGHVRNTSRGEIERMARKQSAENSYDDDSPVLWILEARTLNLFSVQQNSVVAVSDALNSFLPEYLNEKTVEGQWVNEKPLAIYPRHSNARIVAQAGRFTIHGLDQTPLEQIAVEEKRVQLARVRFLKSAVPKLWDDLDTFGVTRPSIFQDLDNLVSYLRYCYDVSGK